MTHTYSVTDTHGETLEISAETPEEAAREYVDGGEWGEEPYDIYIGVRVTDPDGDETWHSITVEVTVPECSGEDGPGEEYEVESEDSVGHRWSGDHELVGGIEENPGVAGGIGVDIIITRICVRCGCERKHHTDAPTDDGTTMAQTRYRMPDPPPPPDPEYDYDVEGV